MKKTPIWILVILLFSGAFSVSIITPVLQEIATSFSVGISDARFALSSSLLGYGIAQLFSCYIISRFSKRISLYTGLSISIFGGLLSFYSPSLGHISFLWAGAFMCSLGASFGLPLGILLANEASSKKQAKVNIALSGVTFAVIPITSIFIGSMIASFLSWN